MLSLVADDLVHEPASGPARIGKASFARFLQHLHNFYFESAENLRIAASGDEAATAEFVLRRFDLATYADRLVGMPVTIAFRARYRFETRGACIAKIAMDHRPIDAIPPRRALQRRGWRWLAALWSGRKRPMQKASRTQPADPRLQVIE
jgi:hypothetical protein